MIEVAPKAPTDVVEYTATFKGLGTDTIASISVGGSGITVDSSSFVNTPAKQVIVWVSGGTLNTTGNVTITVTTTGARVFARVLSIPIETL